MSQLHLDVNLLPYDGTVIYYGPIMTATQADNFYNQLLNQIEWEYDELVIFGRSVTTKRKVAWYGDKPFDYTYSNATKTALPWISPLKQLKVLAQQNSGETYNSCLLNLYHSGAEGMGWHSDAEKDLKPGASIASISLGARRKFAFKHKKTGETVSQILEPGSLLIMKGRTQTHWLHRLPPSKLVPHGRINLTFRTIL